jgi:hypothetical protein
MFFHEYVFCYFIACYGFLVINNLYRESNTFLSELAKNDLHNEKRGFSTGFVDNVELSTIKAPVKEL